MSNSLAIATVTSVLQNMLVRGATADLPQALVTDLNLGNTKVTAAPLDKARTPPNNVNQLNLCLFQVVPSAALRNIDLGGPRSPVALELHYLVSAYGGNDDDRAAHVLLGQAVRLFNDRSLLTDLQAIRDALRGNDLAEQIDHVRLTPRTLSLEDLARVFSMYQTQARASAAYVASVVLIDSTAPRRSPLPVLQRSLTAVPSPRFGPLLDAVTLPQGRSFALLGDALELSGEQLRGTTTLVRLSHPRVTNPIDLTPANTSTGALLRVALPNNPALLPAGVYGVRVVVREGAAERTSNTLILPLAPEFTPPAAPVARVSGTATITLPIRPSVLASQDVALLLGDREIAAPARQATAAQIAFAVPSAPVGQHFVRLRVDGVESDLLDRGAPPDAPPAFNLARRVTIQ